MRKVFVIMLATLVLFMSGCRDLTFNGDLKGYLEFYSTTAILSKHEFRTTSYSDSAGNTTVPSNQEAIIDLYTTNPKSFILEANFTVTTTPSVELSKDLASYGITIRQNPNDLAHFEAKIPQDLLEELDKKGSGLSFHLAPIEAISKRTMPEYSFALRSNTKPAFPKAGIVMETKDLVEGSKKWVLGFELPDLTGVHKDIIALEINGNRYTVNPSAGQGASALASMGSKIVSEGEAQSKLQSKGGSGAFFTPTVAGNGIYFITDDTIGTPKNYTLKLIDKAGFESEMLSISTESTTYGKEIIGFKFESSKNTDAFADAGITEDQVGTISNGYISFPNLPSGLNLTKLTPTITLSGGTISPANGAAQNFSQPVTYTVTAVDGTVNRYTVNLSRILPKPDLSPTTQKIGDKYTVTYPTEELTINVTNANGLPAGTQLHYTYTNEIGTVVNSQVPITSQGSFKLPAGKPEAEYTNFEYWFECAGYEDSVHGTALGSFTVEKKLPLEQLKVDNSNLTAPSYTVNYPDTSITVTIPSSSSFPAGTKLEYTTNGTPKTVDVTDGSFTLEKGEYKNFTYKYTCVDYTDSDTQTVGDFTVVSELPTPSLSVSGHSGNSGDKYYTETGSVTVRDSVVSLPPGTRLYYTIDDVKKNTAPNTGFTLDIQGDAYRVTAWYQCDGYEESGMTQKSYTIWLHKNKIILTATSKDAHKDVLQSTRGDSPTLDFDFYGVTGASFSFSIDSSVNSSFSINNGSTFDLSHNGTTTKGVYATKDGKKVSDTVPFTASATMRPIVIHTYGEDITISVWFEDVDYGSIVGGGAADICGEAWINNKINSNDSDVTKLWWYGDAGKDWEVPKGSVDIPVNYKDADDCGKNTIENDRLRTTAPTDTVNLGAIIREEDTGRVVKVMEKSASPTVQELYNHRNGIHGGNPYRNYPIEETNVCAVKIKLWLIQ